MEIKDIRLAAMQSRKKRAHSSTMTSSDPENSPDATGDNTKNPSKRARMSQSSMSRALIDTLQDDSCRNDDIMQRFIANAEKDRLDQKERWEQQHQMWEKEYVLKMHQLDLQFAELEERKKQHKK